MRSEISEGNDIRCLAFTAPLMDFGDNNDSDGEDYSEFKDQPSLINAKKKWKKLYEIILDKKTEIPLKQMMLKKKHED